MFDFRAKNYGGISNLNYFIKKIFSWDKLFFIVFSIYVTSCISNILLCIYIPKWIVEYLENNKVELLVKTVIYFILGTILVLLSNYCEKEIKWRIERIRKKIVEERVSVILNWNYENYENVEILDLKERVERNTKSINGGIVDLLNNMHILIINGVLLIIASVNLVRICKLYMLPVLGISIIGIKIIVNIRNEDIIEYWNLVAPNIRKVGYISNISKNYAFAKEIKVYNIARWLEDKQRLVNIEGHHIFIQHLKRWIKCNDYLQICLFFQQVIIYGWLYFYIIKDNNSISQFIFWWGIIKTFFSSNQNFLYIYTIVKAEFSQINDLRNFFSFSQKEIMSRKETQSFLKSIKEFNFEFLDVCFTYPNEDKYVLHNFSMKIESGLKIAIVGTNGSGKTTIIKLLMRLYSPNSGVITLNGVDIQKLNLSEYYKIFAPIFQNSECWAMDVAHNISLCNIYDKNIIVSILKQVGLYEKFQNYKGVKTELKKMIHADGIELSGGEMQKLLLARVIYKKDAKILVFDEPTSAMDIISELNIYKTFNSIVRNRNSIFITHRLLSVKFCDRIIVLESGRIIESGTHTDLLNIKGKYFELFEAQARNYKNNE